MPFEWLIPPLLLSHIHIAANVFDGNTSIILSPTTEKMNHPQVHGCDTGIEDDDHQTHKTYHIHNTGTMYLGSLNTHSITMEDCGNQVRRVTYHRPKIGGYERTDKNLGDPQSHAVLDDSQTSIHPPRDPCICKLSPPTTSVQHAPPKLEIATSSSHFAGDHAHPDLKHLEQLLESSLATVAVIRFSGNTLADVLTPRAYDTFKMLCALAALDVSGGIPNPSAFFATRNDLGNLDPSLLQNLSPADLRACRVHISITVDYVILFSWTGFVAVSCLAFYIMALGNGFPKM